MPMPEGMTSLERRCAKLITFYEKWAPVLQEHMEQKSIGDTFLSFHNHVLRDVIRTFPRNKAQIEQMIFVAMEYLLEETEGHDDAWMDNFKSEWSTKSRALGCYWE
jgi:hypothetical protein